jgi:hypothetical protein
MENHFISLKQDDCLRLWQSSRAYINEGNDQILITRPVQDLICMVEDRFVLKKEFWDCRLVNGLSGCGKSIAFALAAAFLANHRINVYWFRDGKIFTTRHSEYFLSRSRSDPFTVVFIDQIDKAYDYYSILRLGDRMFNCAFIGCGSGNISIRRSSSETLVIGETFEFDPHIPFSSFKIFFPSSQDKSADFAYQTTETLSQLIRFRPTQIEDIYFGTNGHFLSMMVLKHALEIDASSINDAWETAKNYFVASMRDFLFLSDIPNFTVLLHQRLFISESTPEISGEFNLDVDHRYIWKMRIHSCLFAQAYHQVLSERPLTHSQINYLNQVQVTDYDNRIMLGFAVERFVIQNLDCIHKAAISCIQNSRSSKELNLPQEISFSKKYSFDDEMEIDPEIAVSYDNNFLAYLFIPLRWNEDWIDLIQLYTHKNSAIVIGNQITLQSAQRHKKSINWLIDNGNFFETLKSRGFIVQKILLFTCSQDPSSQITVSCDQIDKFRDTHIFDYPLENAVPSDIWQKIKSLVKISKVQDTARSISLVCKKTRETEKTSIQDSNTRKKPKSEKFLETSLGMDLCCTCKVGNCLRCSCSRNKNLCNSQCHAGCKNKAKRNGHAS